MTVLTVGAGPGFDYSTLATAVAAAADGDVIQVQAGTYINDFATITTDITIEGVGGMVSLVATVPPPDLMGILTVGTPNGSGPNVTLDNISFSGAAIANADGGNAAGIRYQSGNLTLNNTYFFNNQEGLLANSNPTGTITINHSEFAANGNTNPPPGIEHNLYVGRIQQLTIDNSYFYDPIVGHDIKSRAVNTTIENSRITDPNGTGSYEIDLPNGGNALIRNNVIEKGASAQNSNFIAFGEEGNLNGTSALTVAGNTVVNDHGGGATLVANSTGTAVNVTGNTLYGLTAGQIISGPFGSASSNILQPPSGAPALDTSPAYLPVLPFSLACFVAGTRILTECGYVPVEALRPGQPVVVGHLPEERRSERIIWIGSRRVDLMGHPDPTLVRPIRVRANAFDEGVPARDVLFSPDHAIYADGLLIPVRLLLNGATIVRDDLVGSVQYFHVELDRHDILLAEALPVESYLDTGNREAFASTSTSTGTGTSMSGGMGISGRTAMDIGRAPGPHLDRAVGTGPAHRTKLSCAPFVADPLGVEPVWRRLASRAAGLGYAIPEPPESGDAALRLLAGGRTCLPVSAVDRRHIFVLPQSVASVRLISCALAPCEVAPWIDDRRPLGVAVGRILVAGVHGRSEIPADHPGLTDGWWMAERDGPRLWRWTNGNAALPLPQASSVVEIHLARAHTRRIPESRSGAGSAG